MSTACDTYKLHTLNTHAQATYMPAELVATEA